MDTDTNYVLEEVQTPSPDTIIVLKFNPEEIDLEIFSSICEDISQKFPNNRFITLPSSFSLEYFGVENLRKWYEMVGEFLNEIEVNDG